MNWQVSENQNFLKCEMTNLGKRQMGAIHAAPPFASHVRNIAVHWDRRQNPLQIIGRGAQGNNGIATHKA